MTLFIITCDLPDMEKKANEYQGLYDIFDRMGAKRAQGSVWFLDSFDEKLQEIWLDVGELIFEKFPDLDIMAFELSGELMKRNMKNDVRNWLYDTNAWTLRPLPL